MRDRRRVGRRGPRWWCGATGERARTAWTVVMHSLLVASSLSQDGSTVAGWIAAAVGRREKVLYKHAPSEDAATVLQRSLPAAGVDAGVLASGQVQLADTTDLRAGTDGRHEALHALHLQQLER